MWGYKYRLRTALDHDLQDTRQGSPSLYKLKENFAQTQGSAGNFIYIISSPFFLPAWYYHSIQFSAPFVLCLSVYVFTFPQKSVFVTVLWRCIGRLYNDQQCRVRFPTEDSNYFVLIRAGP